MSFTPLARVQYSQEHLSRAASSILRRTSQSSSSSRRKTGDTLAGDTREGLLDSARDALVDASDGTPQARGREAWQRAAPPPPASGAPRVLRVVVAVVAVVWAGSLLARRKV